MVYALRDEVQELKQVNHHDGVIYVIYVFQFKLAGLNLGFKGGFTPKGLQG